MALRRDDTAASPLTVIVTVVIVAVLLTVAIYALFFDRPEAGVGLVAQRDASGSLRFDVTRESGGLEWRDLSVRFLDRAGHDLAPQYLHLPSGSVDRDDRVEVAPLPPGGTYLLLLLKGQDELARLSVDV